MTYGDRPCFFFLYSFSLFLFPRFSSLFPLFFFPSFNSAQSESNHENCQEQFALPRFQFISPYISTSLLILLLPHQLGHKRFFFFLPHAVKMRSSSLSSDLILSIYDAIIHSFLFPFPRLHVVILFPAFPFLSPSSSRTFRHHFPSLFTHVIPLLSPSPSLSLYSHLCYPFIPAFPLLLSSASRSIHSLLLLPSTACSFHPHLS